LQSYLLFQINVGDLLFILLKGSDGSLPRVKPFKYAYEKEIVLYAYFKKLDYFATECVYAPDAYRGHARALVKDLEALRSTSIIDIIHAGSSHWTILLRVLLRT
jgi:cytoplasmic tRNA 2-thiolation protein 1